MAKGQINDDQLSGVLEAVGGSDGFRDISKYFHSLIEMDPDLKLLFPKNLSVLEERFALYLTERAGGTSEYSKTRGKTSLFCRHAHLAIGPREAELWLKHMRTALVQSGLADGVATKIVESLSEVASDLADPFIFFYRMPLEELRERLRSDRSLARANDRGRNLICAAATAWDVPRLRLLLEFGADVEMRDGGGHNALYRISNGHGADRDGQAAVELLIAHGANVNQATGVGAMTPLHMAARRGTIVIAESLLLAEALVEARDKKGETPLRRTVNCGKDRMVRLLIEHGADSRSQDRFGHTVFYAARDSRIRELLGKGCREDAGTSRG